MDTKKLAYGFAIVLGVAGYAFLNSPQTVIGTGTFFNNYGAVVMAIGAAMLIAGGLLAAVGFAAKSK